MQKIRDRKSNTKIYIVVAVILALIFVIKEVRADYVDLRGGTVTLSVPCIGMEQLLCVVVNKNEVWYLVIHDERGELAIFLSEDQNNLTLLWQRNSI